MLKTFIQFTDFENWPQYFLVDGDYSHLNDVLVNSADTPTELQDEAIDLLLDSETGVIKLTEEFLPDIVYSGLPEDTIVIRIGFIP